MKKIGLSVKNCVADICRGSVKVENVIKIIARTSCRDEEDWNHVIDLYKREYWSYFPDEAEKVIRQLIAEKRVEQPRLKDKPFADIKNGVWVESEKEIIWF